MVKNFLKQSERFVEYHITKLWASKHSIFHLFQFDVLETKDFLGVVVCNSRTLHPSDFHLHDVFEETTSH